MVNQTNVPANRIVDYGSGPRLFATRVLAARMERGNGALTVTFAVNEYRAESLIEAPVPEKEVFAVVGTLTLTQPACVELVNAIQSLLVGIQAQKAQKPTVGAN